MSINIRNLSVKCGNCGCYQTLVGFARQGEYHVYRYECENDICDSAVTRTLVEVLGEIDEFARRDPEWSEKRNEGSEESRGADER